MTAATRPLLHDVHVLIVDDNEDVLELFSAALFQCGAKVLTACVASAALTIIKTARVDVMVSDLSMPGNDGLWHIQQLRRMPHRIPAVAVTAYRSRYDTMRVPEDGFEAFLDKPVDPFQLSSTIAFLVGR